MKAGRLIVCGLLIAVLTIAVGCNPSRSSAIKTEPHEASIEPGAAAVAAAPNAATQPAAEAAVTAAAPAGEAPVLTFEEPICDFGSVGPSSVNSHEFKFSNTGNAVLKIDRFHAPCGCTVPQLDKKEYQPGESGVISVRYTAPATSVTDKKPIYVFSNDPKTPQYELTVKAAVQLKVAVSPQDVSLLLDQPNAGMPTIKVESLDGQPFGITSITSSNETFGIPFDTESKQKEHILTPTANLDRLNNNPTGVIQIKTDHPQSGLLMVRYTAKPQFEVSRPRIILQNIAPGEESVHEIWLRSNYDTKVEIESFTSTSGYMTIQSQEQDGNHLKISVKITPPTQEAASSRRYITDELKITLKSGQVLSVRCSGWFKLN